MSELNELLENISEKELKGVWRAITNTKEYKILARKTQIKNSAVESEDKLDKELTNRQKHSGQVSEVAYVMVQSNENMSEKEALVARLVGLAHDLGHTPFGHDGENFFKEKTGKDFSHAKYGALLFDKMFRKVIEKKNPKTGEYIFKGENRESLEAIKQHIEASLNIGNYIKTGIDLHQEGYYIFELDREMEKLQKEYKDEDGKFIRYNERLDTLEKALNNPCIHAGMLADTVSIMQSDVRDMMSTKNPFDTSKAIISIEDQMQVAKKVGFTPENIKKMQEQLLEVGKVVDVEGLDENETLHKILETLGQVNVAHIQKMVAQYTGKQDLNDKGRFESIPDEYKMFADNYKSKYEEYIGKKLTNEEWKKKRDEGLKEQRNTLKEKNPLLCLTYEIQNSLMYGKILNKGNIRVLNNDLDRNRAIFSRTYDYLYRIGNTKISELTTPEEIAIKKEMNAVYKSKDYPKHFSEIGRDNRKSKSEVIKNLVVYKMQQMGNKDLKEFYAEHIKEEVILNEIESLEKQGLSESEIAERLGGINKVAYEGLKKQDEKMRHEIEILRETKSDEEIAIKLNIEKRNFDEITNGESSLKRYIECRMSLQEMEEITNQLNELEYNENNESNIDKEDMIDNIPTYSVVAEFHDQKSEQFFEDKESAKYNVPPPLLRKVIADSMETVTSKDMTFVSQDVMKENSRELQTEVSQER